MHYTLYLLPNLLGENSDPYELFPQKALKLISSLNLIFAEREKPVRQLIRKVEKEKDLNEVSIQRLDKETSDVELLNFVKLIKEHGEAGIISEAGMPGIADPGAKLVAMAHQNNIRVVPVPGPSSILLALAASGMNGQRFSFIGYLPIDQHLRKQALKQSESQSFSKKEAIIFMETPYRNMQLLKDVIQTLSNETYFTIAASLTLNNEFVRTQTIEKWKKSLPEINKKPAIFILQAYNLLT